MKIDVMKRIYHLRKVVPTCYCVLLHSFSFSLIANWLQIFFIDHGYWWQVFFLSIGTITHFHVFFKTQNFPDISKYRQYHNIYSTAAEIWRTKQWPMLKLHFFFLDYQHLKERTNWRKLSFPSKCWELRKF